MALKLQIKKQPGFSLMEIMVTITILILMSTALMVLFSSAYKAYKYNRKMIAATEQAANAIKAFEPTIRGATKIMTAQNNLITFLAYQKGDTYPAPSKISFYTDGSNFYKSVIAPTGSAPNYIYPEGDKVITLIVGNVNDQNLFSYYNAAGAALGSPPAIDAITMIGLTITINPEPSQSPTGVTESTRVQLRNLKTNL